MAQLRPALRTGLFVSITLVLLVVVSLIVGAPSVLHAMKTFRVYFDNAGGLREGADVSIAGRKVGQVVKMYSPIDPADRPKTGNGGNLEVLVEVQVARQSLIYKQVNVTMYQYTLLGEPVIDFAHGDPASGLAPDGYTFIGKRTPDASEATRRALEKLDPVLAQVSTTLEQLQATAKNLNEMTAPGSDTRVALENYRILGERMNEQLEPGGSLHDAFQNLKESTSESGDFGRTMNNLKRISGDLSDNQRVKLTLQEYRRAAQEMQRASRNISSTFSQMRPELQESAINARQFTDTIKRQPWRLFWPVTKKYPNESQRGTNPAEPRSIPASSK